MRIRGACIIAAVTMAALALAAAPARGDDIPALDIYAELLSRYVTPAGVRYDCWRKQKRDVKALAGVVEDLTTVDLAHMSPTERRAHEINLYNAQVLKLVVDALAITSIRELSDDKKGFEIFDRPMIVIAGTAISLNGLEKTLRQEADDPRVHFAISCASRSCTPLPRAPFRPATLDIQLERATRDFMATPIAVQVSQGKIQASKLFDWYKDDFARGGGPLGFIRKYAPPAVADAFKSLAADPPLVFQEYDWSLNAANGTECTGH